MVYLKKIKSTREIYELGVSFMYQADRPSKQGVTYCDKILQENLILHWILQEKYNQGIKLKQTLCTKKARVAMEN